MSVSRRERLPVRFRGQPWQGRQLGLHRHGRDVVGESAWRGVVVVVGYARVPRGNTGYVSDSIVGDEDLCGQRVIDRSFGLLRGRRVVVDLGCGRLVVVQTRQRQHSLLCGATADVGGLHFCLRVGLLLRLLLGLVPADVCVAVVGGLLRGTVVHGVESRLPGRAVGPRDVVLVVLDESVLPLPDVLCRRWMCGVVVLLLQRDGPVRQAAAVPAVRTDHKLRVAVQRSTVHSSLPDSVVVESMASPS